MMLARTRISFRLRQAIAGRRFLSTPAAPDEPPATPAAQSDELPADPTAPPTDTPATPHKPFPPRPGGTLDAIKAVISGKDTQAVLEAWSRTHMNDTESKIVYPSFAQMKRLWVTLPTGKRRELGKHMHKYAVPYGQHFIFHDRLGREESMRPDGTEVFWAPPLPSWRRMWVGGDMTWPVEPHHGLKTGRTAYCVTSRFVGADLKNFEEGKRPLVLVTQRLRWDPLDDALKPLPRAWSLKESRVHAYVPPDRKPGIKKGMW